MSSSSDHEIPNNAVKGRPTKEQSCNDFCALIDATLKVFYCNFNHRVLTENLFEISKRAGVGKYHLADLVTELGFSARRTQMCILIFAFRGCYCLGSIIL